MLDEARRYPLLRRRRRRWWQRLGGPVRRGEAAQPGGGAARAIAAGLLVAALLLAVWVARRPSRPDPRHEIAASLGLLHAGNYSAARRHAQTAVDAAPGWGLAHAVLARADLAIGDGVAAEGELTRAAANGFDMARGHQLLADAFLLQGDSDRALAEAARAAPRFAGYAARVRARALAAQGDVPAAQGVLAALLARAPDDAAAWSDLAGIRLDAGDIAGASAATAHALADRGNLDARVLKGRLVRSQYGLVAALPWFAAALARDAYYVPALVEQAATLGDAGRYRAMLAATRSALAADPGNPQALYLQAVLAARAGNRDLARAMLGKTGGGVDDLPGALLLQGMLDYGDGRFEQAIERWRELVGRQPMNIVARRLLGAALLRSGDATGALEALRPVALRADADSYTLGLVGRAFEATGERSWAARYLDRAASPARRGADPFGSDDAVPVLADAAAEAPGDPGEAVALVRGLLDAGNVAGALAKAQALAAASPGAPAAQLLLGDTLAATGRVPAAAAAYAHAADLRFDAPTLLRLIETLERIGRHADAVRALALYAAQNPASDVASRLVARAELATGQWDTARTTLERLLASDGGRDVSLLADLSAAALGAGDVAAARSYAAAAYRLQPLDPVVADAYGQALYAAGDDRGARQLIGKAVALVPGNVAFAAHLAVVDGRARAD